MGGTAVPNGYLPIGERIRHRRRARGLSQLRLAGLVDRTEDWVSKVERGEIPVDRISVLIKLADALKVPLSDLLGEHNLPSEQAGALDETAGLRRVLSTVPALATSEPRDLAALEEDLLAATQLRAQAHYARAAAALPRLIIDLELTASASEGEVRGHALGRPALAARYAAPATGGRAGPQGRPEPCRRGAARGGAAGERAGRAPGHVTGPAPRHPVRPGQRGGPPGLGGGRPRRPRAGPVAGAHGGPLWAVGQPLLAAPDRRGHGAQLPARQRSARRHAAGGRAARAGAARALPAG